MKKLLTIRWAGRWATAAVMVALWAWGEPAVAQESRGVRACIECHRNVDTDRERALGHADSISCLTCHHIGMSNDPKRVAAARVKVCQDCHTNVLPTHTRGKLGKPECSACHDIHADKPIATAGLPSARCQSCHERPHVLHENAPDASCTSCHKLHGGKPLRAVDTGVQKQCASCHKDAHPAHAEHQERRWARTFHYRPAASCFATALLRNAAVLSFLP